MQIAIIVAIFLVSLQSLYSYALGMPIYSVIGAALLMVLVVLRSLALSNVTQLSFPRKYSLQLLAPILLLFFSLVAGLFSGGFEMGRLLAFIVIASVPFSYALLSAQANPMNICTGLVVVHGSVLLIQVILFYILGVDFDPVDILSDVQQRGWGGMQQHDILGGFRRLGGLYSEPGTYATFVAPLVAILFLQKDDSKSVKVGVFGLLSLFLTFSLYAWVFCLIMLSIKFLHSKLSALFFAPVILAAYQLAMPYIQFRFVSRSGENGTEFRLEILESILNFNTESFSNFFFGSGLLTTKIPFTYTGAINDIGLLFFLWLASGVFGVLILLVTVFDACWRLRLAGMAVGLILLLSKASIFAPMFWIILIVTHQVGTQRSNYAIRQ